MFWRISIEERPADEGRVSVQGDPHPDGRFVLHRHVDGYGEHLDLRLECGEHLLGWRIDGVTLEDAPWATEKAPHPVRWLEVDGGGVGCEDRGLYRWLERGAEEWRLLLDGKAGRRVVRVAREKGIRPGVVRAIADALNEAGVCLDWADRLIRDGLTARRRAVERFCGLGRELDGSSFEEDVWRKALTGLTLDEIHGQLRAYEVRFDNAYPPAPISRPEELPEDDGDSRAAAAMEILRGGSGAQADG